MCNIRHKYVFYAGSPPVLLWGEPLAAHKDDLLKRMQNVASLTKERLLADFPRTDVRSALAIFDAGLLRKSFGPLPNLDTRRFVSMNVHRLAILLSCEEAATVLQFNSVVPFMVAQVAESQPLAGKPIRKHGRSYSTMVFELRLPRSGWTAFAFPVGSSASTFQLKMERAQLSGILVSIAGCSWSVAQPSCDFMMILDVDAQWAQHITGVRWRHECASLR